VGSGGRALGTLLLLVFTVVQAPQVGWTAPRALLSFAAAVVVHADRLVLVERRSAGPLLRLGLFRSAHRIRAQLTAAFYSGSYAGFQFVVTLYMQSLLGWSALHTALGPPSGALVALSSGKVGAFIDRFGTPRLVTTGFVLMGVGCTLFLRGGPHPVYAVVMRPILLLGAASALIHPRSTFRRPTVSRTTSRAWCHVCSTPRPRWAGPCSSPL
jgi:hypothetical protein